MTSKHDKICNRTSDGINFSNSQYINVLLFWALSLNLFTTVFVPLFWQFRLNCYTRMDRVL